MKKKIIWHLGFRKTGTTSVQYLLRSFKPRSDASLFISSRDDLTRAWRELYVNATREQTRPDVKRVRSEMSKVADYLRSIEQNTIVISDENLFAFSLFGRTGDHFFHWAAEVLPIIESEFSDFDNVFFAYTRPLEAWLKSSYSQEVKRGRTWRSYESWRPKVPASCNWDEGLDLIRKSVRSTLVLRTQSDDIGAGLPLGTALLEFAGVPRREVLAIGETPRLNESLSTVNMRVLRLFNFFKLNGLIRATINRRVRARELSGAAQNGTASVLQAAVSTPAPRQTGPKS